MKLKLYILNFTQLWLLVCHNLIERVLRVLRSYFPSTWFALMSETKLEYKEFFCPETNSTYVRQMFLNIDKGRDSFFDLLY